MTCGGYAPKKFVWRNETIQTIAGSNKRFKSVDIVRGIHQEVDSLKNIVFIESPILFAESMEISEQGDVVNMSEPSREGESSIETFSMQKIDQIMLENSHDHLHEQESEAESRPGTCNQVGPYRPNVRGTNTISFTDSPTDLLICDGAKQSVLLKELLRPFDEQDRYMWHFSTETSNFITIYSKRHSPWQRLLIPLAYR